MRVLAVDDEQVVLDAIQVQLSAATGPDGRPYEVDTATSAAEALKRLDQEHFDIVVTDMMMEQSGDGLGVVRSLSDKTTATIVLTGYGTICNCVKAMRAGAWDYIQESAPDGNAYEQLLESIEQALRTKSEDPEASRRNPDTRWVQENLSRLMDTYRGEVVAVLHGKVIDHDESYSEVADRVAKNYPFTNPTIVSLPDMTVEAIE